MRVDIALAPDATHYCKWCGLTMAPKAEIECPTRDGDYCEPVANESPTRDGDHCEPVARKPRKPRKSQRREKAKAHDCVQKVNVLLAEQGDCLQRFVANFASDGAEKSDKIEFARAVVASEKIAVATERKDSATWKRGKSWLLASFCPFCGIDLRKKVARGRKRGGSRS